MAPHDESEGWDIQLFRQQLRAVGKRLRAARRSGGWTQQDLANQTWIGQPSLSTIEGGKQNITLEVLSRLAAALGLHWADLIDDRLAGIPSPHPEPAPFTEQLAAFGTRVYETRVLQRLSQQNLMARTGIERKAISVIELGTQNVTLETLWRLAAGLRVHWADLLDDRKAHPPRPRTSEAGLANT